MLPRHLPIQSSSLWAGMMKESIPTLDKGTLKTLTDILKKNPRWLDDLDDYEIPPVKTIYNMELKLDSKNDVKLMKEFIPFIHAGRTYKEIEKEMRTRKLNKYIPDTFGNYVLQMTNIDEERKGIRTVWREGTLLKM